jgi:coenzyme F420 hydrogenase subunit beta
MACKVNSEGEVIYMIGKNTFRGQKELQKTVLDTGLCTGCGACIDLCPYFKSYKGRTAMLFPCTLTQGRCFAYCPKVEVDLDDLSQKFFGRPYGDYPLGSYRAIMISRAGEKIERADFQAGGTVSAIIHFALKKGYVDGAVLTDRTGLLPVPRLITNPEGVFSCASSKYTAAPTLSALNQGIRDGFKQIGIVATPCQALATALMRSNQFEEEDFVDPIGLVVGLFCTWALDFRAFEACISKRLDITKIAKMDIPPPPADTMEIYMENGDTVTIPLDEVRPLVPEGCSYCFDMTAEFSDLSVGVLEGRPDRNILIVRTQRGQRIVEEARKEGYLSVSEIPKENLDHLQWAAANKKRRAFTKARQGKMVNALEQDGTYYVKLRAETLERVTA